VIKDVKGRGGCRFDVSYVDGVESARCMVERRMPLRHFRQVVVL